MNNIKTQFSIKDLENLSGIKAHTIRIWEKRYQIFNPNRTETNIRYYSLGELLKLLNITFLNDYGYKISRVAKYSDSEIDKLVRQIYSDKNNVNYSVNVLKVAMLNFDAALFNETYTELSKTKSFSEIFFKVYIPFLTEIGLLWQTNSLKPIHEHFISYLIFQKLVENISLIQREKQITNHDLTFVLFLPENEIHEISLLFINYELINRGYKTIYLGSSVPHSDLLEINKLFDNIQYVSYFTIMPEKNKIDDYLSLFKEEILTNGTSKLFVSGAQAKSFQKTIPNILKFDSIEDLVNAI
jgi:MerR family transcriptional regulator, light-induced transcriptional regulator